MLPFVNVFYSAPSQYWWEDEMRIVHVMDQGEGGEQGCTHAIALLFGTE